MSNEGRNAILDKSSSASAGVSSRYRLPVKHNMRRRKAGHNYTSSAAYLITVETTSRRPLLGTLIGDSPETAAVESSPLGRIVIANFLNIENIVYEKTGGRVQVIQYQLMPDHFHGILYVRDTLPDTWNLGKIIGAWKGACSRAYWKQNAELMLRAADELDAKRKLYAADEQNVEGCEKKEPLFSTGFNDRPLLASGQLHGWIAYLRDNPRRLWLKHHYPNRLQKEYNFAAGKSQTRYTAVGNTFLLTYPERQQVRCHRNLSAQEIQTEVAYYLRQARAGIVLVSPFISPAEKAVYDACYTERLPMVRLVKRALDGKFVYPQGRDFDACVQGFLLVLAPFEEGSEDAAEKRISRSQCLTLNDFAAELATQEPRNS